jgi:hypothetical protein
MKARLETRWRLLYAFAIPGVVVAVRHLTSVEDARRMMGAMEVLLLFGAVFLGGAGIRTQPAFTGTKSLHGSMYYTLSLPVSRFRLLAVRAGAGLLEMAGVILIVISVSWLKFPLMRGTSTPVDLLKLVLAAIVCTACCYFFSVVLATFLDEIWQIWGSVFVIGLSWWAVAQLSLAPSVDIFCFMGEASPLMTHKLPWPAMAVSLIVSAVLFLAALKVVQTREY